MRDQPFEILSAPVIETTEVKRSRFICYLAHVQGEAQAKAFIAGIRAKHPDANHNCWAYLGGRPEDSVRIGFSDDGEPSGCAGRPMLNVLQGSGLGEICAVVSRYFGGIKLGTGGMARAYGGAVSAALKVAETTERRVMRELSLVCDYDQLNLVEQLVGQFDGEIQSADYQQQIHLQLALDNRQARAFAAALSDRSQGRLQVDLDNQPA